MQTSLSGTINEVTFYSKGLFTQGLAQPFSYHRPHEAPLYVSGKFAYFWAPNQPYLSGKLHIFGLEDCSFGRNLGVYCIFLTDFQLNSADPSDRASYRVLIAQAKAMREDFWDSSEA